MPIQKQRVKNAAKQKTNVDVEMQQSLALSQELISTTFGCVCYLRDLFPEDAFEERKVNDLSIKAIKRGVSKVSDTFLDWIEKGCFDALKKKYLKAIVFGIYEDANKPNEMIETYTVRVEYPERKSEEKGEENDTQTSVFYLSTQQGNEVGQSVALDDKQFKQMTVKILKTVCILTQTLKPLPENKYLTIQIYYHDEFTPKDYEPPFFRAASEEEVKIEFEDEPLKVEFGRAENKTHKLIVSIKTTQDMAKDLVKKKVDEKKTEDAVTTQDMAKDLVKKKVDDKKSEEVKEQPSKKVEINKPGPSTNKVQGLLDKVEKQSSQGQLINSNQTTQPLPIPSLKPMNLSLKTSQTLIIEKESFTNQSPVESDIFNQRFTRSQLKELSNALNEIPAQNVSPIKSTIKCYCGDNDNSCDLIKCNKCLNWSHTVCSGYFSNRDKRLDVDSHTCYFCLYNSNSSLISFIKDLSTFRRVLSILYHEGIQSPRQFAPRLGYSLKQSKSLLDKCLKNGFLIKKLNHSNRTKEWIVVKNEENKKKLKFYFQSITDYPEFKKFFPLTNKRPSESNMDSSKKARKVSINAKTLKTIN
ncbi:DNA-binding HORMA domain-containing protein [Rozella allomycis CSF55]|uniref:DNA-binding HORMA domain-containing protein n=1 Tax=Rozella allomycis (strain CSF55) TaxID=988480 RepID=A0A075AU51_ROZAC|nr:DNA-binding HORMA domain-containing protein [Rozella allomycis CSF55]|eukprot:EPZ33793.1 DNA-binding HORMA domain-containing protein [Rozella allomycis CSF55]